MRKCEPVSSKVRIHFARSRASISGLRGIVFFASAVNRKDPDKKLTILPRPGNTAFAERLFFFFFEKILMNHLIISRVQIAPLKIILKSVSRVKR